MRPAFQITPDDEHLRILGELAVIQGQIEWLITTTVQSLLGVSGATSRLITGSTSLATNADIWIGLLRERSTKPDSLKIAEAAHSRLSALVEGRNAFMHSVFGATVTYPNGVTDEFIMRPDIPGNEKLRGGFAMKLRNRNLRDVSDLRQIRDEAAFVSVLFAHVNWEHHDVDHWGSDPSPWADIVSVPHPPPLARRQPRQAKKLVRSSL